MIFDYKKPLLYKKFHLIFFLIDIQIHPHYLYIDQYTKFNKLHTKKPLYKKNYKGEKSRVWDFLQKNHFFSLNFVNLLKKNMILTTFLVIINVFLLFKLNVKWKYIEAGTRQKWNQAGLMGLTLFASVMFSFWLIADFINNYANDNNIIFMIGLIILLLFFTLRGALYKFLS
jgi:hypothetical protein